MGNYLRLKNYLNSKEIFFEEDALEDGAKFLRLKQAVPNAEPLLIIFAFNDDETYVDAIVYNIAKITSVSKHDELMEVLNQLNSAYRYPKFTVDREGNVKAQYAVSCATSNYDFEDFIFPVFLLIQELTDGDIRKKFMRLMWA